MLSHHAGGARRWDARPSRLHLRHQELQVQGGGDQEDQQGKDHRILRTGFSTIFYYCAENLPPKHFGYCFAFRVVLASSYRIMPERLDCYQSI